MTLILARSPYEATGLTLIVQHNRLNLSPVKGVKKNVAAVSLPYKHGATLGSATPTHASLAFNPPKTINLPFTGREFSINSFGKPPQIPRNKVSG